MIANRAYFRHASLALAAVLIVAAQSAAQSAPKSAPKSAPRSGTPAVAKTVVLSAEQQIASAVLPLPNDLRANATVLGYGADGKLTTLRAGTGGMTCLASNPKSAMFHVACYHKSMEPFMARGRELRAQGVTGDQVDSVRFREAREGTLVLPKEPAVLYSLTGGKGSYNPASNKIAKPRPLYVVYIPYATSESTGLSAIPAQDSPWIMFPGTPKAHIMFIAKM